MMEEQSSPLVKAVLFEIQENLKLFLSEGKEHTIFINKLPLSLEEREYIRDFLGIGSVKIEITDSGEPAEWVESATSGIWYGVFYNAAKEPALETIEIAFFPAIAAAQSADIKQSLEMLTLKLQPGEGEQREHFSQ